jgi:hypothetical protein
MRTKSIFSGSLIVLIVGLLVNRGLAQKQNPGQESPAQRKANVAFMRQKLDYSQKIFEGIALENYNQVATNAIHLGSALRKNLFHIVNDPTYTDKSLNFAKDIAELEYAALAKSTPDMLSAYTKVTGDCVNCHQSFRRAQLVRTDLKTPTAPK